MSIDSSFVRYPMFKYDANESMLKCKLALHNILFHKNIDSSNASNQNIIHTYISRYMYNKNINDEIYII